VEKVVLIKIKTLKDLVAPFTYEFLTQIKLAKRVWNAVIIPTFDTFNRIFKIFAIRFVLPLQTINWICVESFKYGN